MSKKSGIDLGAGNIVAAQADMGIVFCEPAAIAVERDTKQPLYFGTRAEQLFVAPPRNVVLQRPFRDGVTAELEFAKKIISDLLADKLRGTEKLLLSVPCSASEIEEGVLVETAAQCDVRSPHIVFSPVAALAGAEVGICDDVLIVEIGATRTNIALVCDGELIYMRSIPVAGEAFDRAIAEYLLTERGARVSLRTAESVKMTIGSVWLENAATEMSIVGRHPSSGEAAELLITGEEMYRALEVPTAAILEAVCIAISHIPSEYVHRVFSSGILLAGGSALLHGLDRMISGVTGVKTVLARNPITAVANGLAIIADSLGDRVTAVSRNLSALYLGKCHARRS